jgi:hypothetical protein
MTVIETKLTVLDLYANSLTVILARAPIFHILLGTLWSIMWPLGVTSRYDMCSFCKLVAGPDAVIEDHSDRLPYHTEDAFLFFIPGGCRSGTSLAGLGPCIPGVIAAITEKETRKSLFASCKSHSGFWKREPRASVLCLGAAHACDLRVQSFIWSRFASEACLHGLPAVRPWQEVWRSVTKRSGGEPQADVRSGEALWRRTAVNWRQAGAARVSAQGLACSAQRE